MAGPFNFAAAVLDAHLAAGSDWRAQVVEAAARRGLAMAGEEVRRAGEFIGWAHMLDPAEAEAAFGGAPWFSLADRGAFRGRPVGFLNWEHYGEGVAPFDQLAVFDLRGTVGRIDSGEAREPIAWKRYRLDALLSRFGFDDGDALLTLPGGDYEEAMARRIEAALAEAGYPAALGVGISREVTAHNPVVLAGGLLRRASDWTEVPATADILARIEVELLAFDLDLLGDAEFWRWP
jgi:hypothetical protein